MGKPFCILMPFLHVHAQIVYMQLAFDIVLLSQIRNGVSLLYYASFFWKCLCLQDYLGERRNEQIEWAD